MSDKEYKIVRSENNYYLKVHTTAVKEWENAFSFPIFLGELVSIELIKHIVQLNELGFKYVK